MTMPEKKFEEWLERAFRLAFFLHGDRETAKRVATEAMNKLETASNAQFKRFYYQPTGRAENSRAARSRVSLGDLQLLQRLVFVESEKFERAREISENVGERSLLKFFIKHLVRIALKRNSFYVTLAVSRILHNYATADAMEIYNIVVQDPERVHDDYYYRSRKGVLMKELKARFDDFLQTTKVNRGEERFQTLETTEENLSKTAKKSLEIFTPWNSECAIPEKFDPFFDIVKPFHFDKKDPDEEHRIEINRIHAALHPDCFRRLTKVLDLPAPEEKMEIPKFMINTNYSDIDDENWRNPPHLEADELQQIKEILNAHAESRKAMNAGFLRVFIDGDQRALIDSKNAAAANLTLDETAEMIEVYDENQTLLATHLLSFAELQKGLRRETFRLENGEKIAFDFAPVFDDYGEVAEINFSVGFNEEQKSVGIFEKAKIAASNLFSLPVLKPAISFGLIILALILGWFVLRNLNIPKEEVVTIPETQNQNIVIETPNVLPKENINAKRKNDVPAPENRKVPNVILPKPQEKPIEKNKSDKPKSEIKKESAPKKETVVETPKRELFAVNKNKREEPETDNERILRLPIRETTDFPQRNVTRNANSPKTSGKNLNEIRKIYIEIAGDGILGKQIAERMSNEINSVGRFEIVADRETADAALKIYVRHEADVDKPEEKIITAIVRLVNSEGFVVYPNRRGVSGWKYVGEIGKLPKRIAADLNK